MRGECANVDSFLLIQSLDGFGPTRTREPTPRTVPSISPASSALGYLCWCFFPVKPVQCMAVLCMLPASNAVHGPLIFCFPQLYTYISHAQILVSSPLSSSFPLCFLISSVSTLKITFLCSLSCPTLLNCALRKTVCNRLNVILLYQCKSVKNI